MFVDSPETRNVLTSSWALLKSKLCRQPSINVRQLVRIMTQSIFEKKITKYLLRLYSRRFVDMFHLKKFSLRNLVAEWKTNEFRMPILVGENRSCWRFFRTLCGILV